MPRSIRFHLDEHCPTALAEALRRRGIDVTTTVDVGLLEASDEAHIAFAVNEVRVIFTHDADFLRLAAGGTRHSGIAYCQMGTRSLGELVRLLVLLWELLEPEEMQDRIEFL